MSIKINGSDIIDNTGHVLNVSSITFSDATVQDTGDVGGTPVGDIVKASEALMHTLDNPNAYSTSTNDNFGSSVAISGDYAIVGTSFEDDAGGGGSGKAYIFKGGALVHTLDNPNAYSTSALDYFGSVVAIYGNYAIVGAYQEDDGSNNSGKAYIFNVTTGLLLHTLDNPNAYSTGTEDRFGSSVAIDGNYAIVGAYAEDEAAGASSGKAYIFNVTTGTLVHTLNNPNAYSTVTTDFFGVSVAISGNYAIVGASAEDDSGGSASGKAYIFDIITGVRTHTLNNPNAYSTSANDNFGNRVAISGNYAIVSAYTEDDAGGASSGKAYIFNVTTGALVHTLDNPNPYDPSALDQFGQSVAISGDYAIVGAYQEDDGGVDSGKAYIFNVNTGKLLYTLDNPNAYSIAAYDEFGISVAISGNYAIVGARGEDDAGGASSGKVYIFNLDEVSDATFIEEVQFTSGYTMNFKNDKIFKSAHFGGELTRTLNNPNAYSTATGDQFGYSVAMSGNYAIVGALFEDDAGGSSSGKAYIFNVTTGLLLHTLDNPNAYSTAANDQFGWSVAISGNYAIVGARYENDASGNQSGKAYIFDVTTGLLLHTLDNPNAYSTGLDDYFGYSVAISGDYAIVSAPNEDINTPFQSTNTGKAYIFNVTTGDLVHTLDNPHIDDGISASSDYFGNSVAISGNYAIVSAPFTDDVVYGDNSGRAYIFNVTTGALLHTLDNPNAYGTVNNDNFGNAVAISGNYAIVGVSAEWDAGGSVSGKAYIFNVTTGTLVHTLDNPTAYGTSQSDRFGQVVAIDGNYAIVGAYSEGDAGGTASGKAYIFDVITGELLYTLDNPNAYSTSNTDNFGWSVAISGNYAIVSALFEDDVGVNTSGKAYIFTTRDLTYLDKIVSLAGTV